MQIRKICGWIIVLAALLGGVTGCQGEHHNPVSSPASSFQDVTTQLNFYARTGVSDTLAVYSAPGELVVQTLPGTYLLTYTTSTDSREYHLVFTASKVALLYIGLLDQAQAQTVLLYPGHIAADAQPLPQSTATLAVFALPGSLVAWQDVFAFEANSE